MNIQWEMNSLNKTGRKTFGQPLMCTNLSQFTSQSPSFWFSIKCFADYMRIGWGDKYELPQHPALLLYSHLALLYLAYCPYPNLTVIL